MIFTISTVRQGNVTPIFSVKVNNLNDVESVALAEEATVSAFLGQHNITSDDDMSVFDGYIESARKLAESDGLMVSIDRKYGYNRIARVELDESLVNAKVVFQNKYEGIVIREFTATEECDLEYGEDWVTIQLKSGKLVSLSKNAKSLTWV